MSNFTNVTGMTTLGTLAENVTGMTTSGTFAENVTGMTTSGTSTSDVYTEITASEWLWKLLPPALFIGGLTGNGLTVAVIRRLGLEYQPTLVFIAFLAVTDSVVLLTGLPRYWLLYTFKLDIPTLSEANCKLYFFFIYLSMQYSSWILVGLTIERVVKTHFVNKYRVFYTPKKVAIGLCVTLFILILVNGHFFFTNGINDYTKGDCDSLTPEFFYFDQYVFVYIDFTLLSAVPFLIMFVGNILLIRTLKRFTRQRTSMVHRSTLARANRVSVRMTRMCTLCTFYFIVATAPVSVYFILDSYLSPRYEAAGNQRAAARMELTWSVTYLLQFSNYCVNFFIYTFANSRFMSELKQLVHCKPSLRRMRIYTTQLQNGSSRRSNIDLIGAANNSTSVGLDLNNSSSDEMQV